MTMNDLYQVLEDEEDVFIADYGYTDKEYELFDEFLYRTTFEFDKYKVISMGVKNNKIVVEVEKQRE
jgi:hypothetical protein